MSDLIYDPYKGVETEEEREAIYKSLLAQHDVITQECERKRKVYNDLSSIWDKQQNIQIEAEQRFHKNIITIAAGSFGVSFAFINQIVPLENAIKTDFLLYSWLFFGLSIIFAIFESRVSSLIQDKLLSTIEKNIERGYEGKPYMEPSKLLIMLPTRILNWSAFILFAMGVLCLLYFVHLNMAMG